MLTGLERLDIQSSSALPTQQRTYVKVTLTRRGAFSAAAALLVLLAGLQGCSKIEHAVGKRPPSRTTSATPTDPAQLALAGMVSAVSSSKPTNDLQLKFELRNRPVVGQPVDVDLALIPGQDLERIYTTFQGSDGLDVTVGAKTDEIKRPPVGVPITYAITIVPQREGVFSVSAAVLADSSGSSVTRTFSVPVIAVSGMSPSAMADAPSAGSGSGGVRGH